MSRRGFTLIEMMLVVLIIAVLAAIATSRMAGVPAKAKKAVNKGNLGALRSALSVYYGDMQGQFPGDITSLTQSSKYLASFPQAKLPSLHADSSAVTQGSVPDDSGGWYYDNVAGSNSFGTVWVNCTHTDDKGTVWTNY